MNCIVVPIYKEYSTLEVNELISLNQLYKVLGKHTLFLVGPQHLQWNTYIADAKQKGADVSVKFFNKDFFKSIAGYNQLLTSLVFYKAFEDYEYMLIYQTDAFVFKDELDFWCQKKFDYIGAPWFEGMDKADQTAKMIGVGNGGFSLRNVHSCIKGLKKLHFLRQVKRFYKFFINKSKASNGYYDITQILFSPKAIYEDVFWAIYMPLVRNSFSVAPIESAYKFSFEINPQVLFDLTNKELPFGCHAWWRYNVDFWRPIIQKSGHSMETSLVTHSNVR